MRRTLHGKPSPRRFHPRNSSNPDARVPASAQRHCGKTRESGCMNFPDRRTDRDAEKKKPLPQTRKRQCAICITVVIQPATTSHRCRLTGRSEICQKKRERLSGWLRFGGKAASVSRKPGFEFVYADFANQDFILSRNTEIHGKAVVEPQVEIADRAARQQVLPVGTEK